MALKPLTYEDQTVVISPLDSAIDTERSDIKAYAEVMMKDPAAWRKLIKPKDGETLTEFIIGVIPTEQLVRIHDECEDKTGEELRWRCFLCSVRGINNWANSNEKIPTIDRHGVSYVDPDWLSKTFVRGLRYTALHVGMLAWAFNNLTEDESKN